MNNGNSSNNFSIMKAHVIWRIIWALGLMTVLSVSQLFASGGKEKSLAGDALQSSRQCLAESTLNFALNGNPDTLDPHATSGTLTFQVVRSIYDTLVEPNREGLIVPALAQSWQEDGLTWEFQLRPDIRFHNGDPLTSLDVKASLERLRDLNSPFRSDFEYITAIETPDEMTVVLQLSQHHAPLLASLASGWAAILPHQLIEQDHDFANAPVGTGPFIFEEWLADSRLVLHRNPEYWQQEGPSIECITMHIIPDAGVQIQALQNGDIDITYIVNADHVALLERHPDTRIETYLSSLVLVLAINTRRAPLDSLPFRQAIAHAIDKQSVLDVAYGGGNTIGSFIDYGSPYYRDYTHYYPYDTSLSIAAQEDSDALTKPLEIVVPQNYPPHVQAGEIYQQMLAEANIDTTLRTVDWPTWINEIYNGDNFDLTVIGHTGRLDPDTRFLEYGYTGWNNEEVDMLVAEARTTQDFEKRKNLYDSALDIMAQELPFVFVGTSNRHIGLRKGIDGFHMDRSLDTFDFRHTTITPN